MAEAKTKTKCVNWSESSSGSSLSYRKDGRFPCKASDWTTEHLLDLGINYEETFTDLLSFMLPIKEVYRKTYGEEDDLPEVYRNILQYTKDRWNFSFDFRREYQSDDDGAVHNGIQRIKDAMKSLNEEDTDTVQKDSLEVYMKWRLNLVEFWHHFVMILRRWRKDNPRVERYTILFMAFSRICFLVPELGQAYCEAFTIKDHTIRGMPDVRFLAAPPSNANRLSNSYDSQILIVTEVRQFDSFLGDYNAETFSARSVSKRALGQHGIKLLMERSSSFFCPGVVGVLCVGTKIILTYLHITWDHYRRIKEKGKVDNTKATISYTRPYDFLDVCERMEIMEALMWFGMVQRKHFA